MILLMNGDPETLGSETVNQSPKEMQASMTISDLTALFLFQNVTYLFSLSAEFLYHIVYQTKIRQLNKIITINQPVKKQQLI